jgi:hypothetical protein
VRAFEYISSHRTRPEKGHQFKLREIGDLAMNEWREEKDDDRWRERFKYTAVMASYAPPRE